MLVQYASDLHLDQLTSYISSELIIPKSEILILGGDICHISSIVRHIAFFKYINKSFQYVIYVPGNHEFYSDCYSIGELENHLKHFLKSYSNIIYLNNSSVFIDDILFTGSCLWCDPTNEPPPWFLIDITSDEIKNMHYKSVEYLKKVSCLQYPKHVIITHYPPVMIPTKRNRKYDDYYQNSDIYLPYQPPIWIFGHIHENICMKTDSTVYLSNQRKDKKYNSGMTFSV